MEFNDNEHKLFMMLDPISFFQSVNDIIPMELQYIFVDFDVFLVVAKKVQLINFQVNAFFFTQSFYDRNNGLNDACFLFDLNIFDNFHKIVA